MGNARLVAAAEQLFLFATLCTAKPQGFQTAGKLVCILVPLFRRRPLRKPGAMRSMSRGASPRTLFTIINVKRNHNYGWLVDSLDPGGTKTGCQDTRDAGVIGLLGLDGQNGKNGRLET